MIVVIVFLSIFWTKWNSIWFRKSNGKLSPRSYPIQFERNWKYSFVSVYTLTNYFAAGGRSCISDWINLMNRKHDNILHLDRLRQPPVAPRLRSFFYFFFFLYLFFFFILLLAFFCIYLCLFIFRFAYLYASKIFLQVNLM